MRTTYLSLISIPLFVAISFSCTREVKSDENKAKDEKEKVAKEEMACTYSYNPENAKLTWTAYKFTEKVGVAGTFKEVNASFDGEAFNSPEAIMSAMSFVIPINSVSSGDAGRDSKIQEYFFGTLTNTSELRGSIMSAADGEGMLKIMMNEQEQEVPFTYEVEDATVTFKSDIDVSNWGALPGIEALNEVCKDVHTGADGKSVLWPNVSLKIAATLDKNCPA